MFFVKSRRAQNESDFETWIAGGVCTTLNAFDNNGDSRATVLIIDGTRVNDVRVYEDGIVPTVISRYGTGGGNVPMIFPIQDGRDMEKKQNGLGVSDDGAPSYTLDRTGAQAVAYDEYNDSIGDIHHTLRAGTKQSTGVLTSTVRRLTPLECERLQGFPDNWTEGQADTHRYKQMGNAVCVNVVDSIIKRLIDIPIKDT